MGIKGGDAVTATKEKPTRGRLPGRMGAKFIARQAIGAIKGAEVTGCRVKADQPLIGAEPESSRSIHQDADDQGRGQAVAFGEVLHLPACRFDAQQPTARPQPQECSIRLRLVNSNRLNADAREGERFADNRRLGWIHRQQPTGAVAYP